MPITVREMEEISEAERRVFAAIKRATKLHGNPSVREIATAGGYNSPGDIHRHMKKLAEKGYIAMPEKRRSRSIRILRRAIRKEAAKT
jgi:SOS-response transcriptional repressor LexA